MVNVELIIFVVLVIVSLGIIYRFRDRIVIQTMLGIPLKKPITIFGKSIKKIPIIYAVLIRTKIGLKLTDKIVARFRRSSKWVGYCCIVVGIISSLGLTYLLVKHIIDQLLSFNPVLVRSVSFVLPFKVKGAIYVPLGYWLVSILLLATIHEFGHALVARAYNIKIKYTGPAFFGILLPIIPAAYVEPDEKEVNSRPKKERLSVYSAGAVFNIISGIVVLVILLMAVNPLTSTMIKNDGIVVDDIISIKLKQTGLHDGQVITKLQHGDYVYSIQNIDDLATILDNYPPGDNILIFTSDNQEYFHTLEKNPNSPEKSMLGISVSQHESFTSEAIKGYGVVPLSIIKWIRGLLLWISILSLGIGFFNLFPMIPLDGGLLVKTMVDGTKYEKPVVYGISALFLLILIVLFFI